MRHSYRERGVALLLVLWLVAAMAVTVAGAMALAREEVSVTGSRLNEAKAFAIGKAVARLAILDRKGAIEQSDAIAADAPEAPGRVFSTRYLVDGLTVEAFVYPATGFVSLAESKPDIWSRLLVSLGGMNEADAKVLSDRIVESEMRATAGGSARGSFAAARAAAMFGAGTGTEYVEQLLGVEGMTRVVYDRVKRSISPFGSGGEPVLSDAPPELQSAFASPDGDPVETESQGGSDAGGSFCVEVKVTFSETEALSQRIWVQASDMADSGGIRLVRIERPVPNQLGRLG